MNYSTTRPKTSIFWPGVTPAVLYKLCNSMATLSGNPPNYAYANKNAHYTRTIQRVGEWLTPHNGQKLTGLWNCSEDHKSAVLNLAQQPTEMRRDAFGQFSKNNFRRKKAFRQQPRSWWPVTSEDLRRFAKPNIPRNLTSLSHILYKCFVILNRLYYYGNMLMILHFWDTL